MKVHHRSTLPFAALAHSIQAVELVCHPSSPCSAPFEVTVQWTKQPLGSGWALALTYTVAGEIARLRLPLPTGSHAKDGLWAQTCFEAFFSEPTTPAYRELNFSPSTQWAHYRFTEERVRDPLNPALMAPVVHFPVVSARRLVMAAAIAVTPEEQLQTLFAPTAVLQLTDGSLSYWAVNHPAPQPDFHARTGWTTPLRWALV